VPRHTARLFNDRFIQDFTERELQGFRPRRLTEAAAPSGRALALSIDIPHDYRQVAQRTLAITHESRAMHGRKRLGLERGQSMQQLFRMQCKGQVVHQEASLIFSQRLSRPLDHVRFRQGLDIPNLVEQV
jgi:hypothetical protein